MEEIAKYIILGVKAEAEKEYGILYMEKVALEVDKQRCEKKVEALTAEVEDLKKQLTESKEVIAGYRETMKEGLGIKENDKLADLQFEKGVANETII